MSDVEMIARSIAADLGRDWNDCGAYERDTYRFEAERRFDGEPPRGLDEPSDCVWRGAIVPFARNY